MQKPAIVDFHTPYDRSFAKLCTSIPNRRIISDIKKPQKERITSRLSEPLYAQNPLISSHFLYFRQIVQNSYGINYL